ncbi:MAG: MarR family transcriptional regulator [Candidatus Nanoarchaeia archaeon]
MSDEFSENEIAGSKWQILKILSKYPQTPKQLAEKLGTTVANMSQQLKLLEAYGYLKKTRADKGPEGRKTRDLRVLYSLVRGKTLITTIAPGNVKRKEIRLNLEAGLLINILMLDIKDDVPYLLNFFFNNTIVDHIDSAYFIKRDDKEINLFIITKKLEHFRDAKSTLKVKYKGEEKIIRFWSHTVQEVRDGLANKEDYFVKTVAEIQLLYEKEKADFYS